MELEAHLFRREAGRLVSVLTRIFGLDNLELAEDVVQDALCRALETWQLRGVPENPSAWLLVTAKRRAFDMLRRERTARTFAPQVARHIENAAELVPLVEASFLPAALRDDQLRMMFSCCDPRLGEEAQVALVLHVLCGFHVNEIAQAFLSNDETVKKRITRAKKSLAGSRQMFELTTGDVPARLDAVHRALYLLFNEGFHGACEVAAVRTELCQDAIRLVSLLLEHPATATPSTHALLALMCFHAARLPTRLDDAGNLHSLAEQDRARWDPVLIAQGLAQMELATVGDELTDFHVEAAIAAVHCTAARPEDTDWNAIVGLYDLLVKLRPSPVVELQRAIAIAEQLGPTAGLAAVAAIMNSNRLVAYPFYAATLGELEMRSGNIKLARTHFATAMELARNDTERRYFERRVKSCETR